MQILGIDFDGVIQDSSRLKKNYSYTNFGIDIPTSQSKRGYLTSNKILTGEQYDQMVMELYETDLGLGADLVKGADTAINELLNSFSLTIITSRSPRGVEMAKRWLNLHGFADINIIGTDNKDKLKFLTGFSHYVDDDLAKLTPLVGQVENLYLFSWEYNSAEELPLGIKRVSGWDQLESTLSI